MAYNKLTREILVVMADRWYIHVLPTATSSEAAGILILFH